LKHYRELIKTHASAADSFAGMDTFIIRTSTISFEVIPRTLRPFGLLSTFQFIDWITVWDILNRPLCSWSLLCNSGFFIQ